MAQRMMLLGASMLVVLASGAAAQAWDGATPILVERPGEQEFSGAMLARPQPAQRARAVALLDGWFEITGRIAEIDVFIFEAPDGATENEVARDLLATGLFEFVEPDWIVYPIGGAAEVERDRSQSPMGNCPNDPLFPEQWHHGPDRLASCNGWLIHTGSPSVTVAICDTGVRITHEDLLLHRQEGYNAVDRRWESQGGDISDLMGSGTAMTGVAAANGNNARGVAGVGWDLGHRMIRVSNSTNGAATISDITHGAIIAAQQGDRAISVSYSGVTSAAVATTARQVKSLGGLLVWAAGSSGARMDERDRDEDDVIIVGATDRDDQRQPFSNYGRMLDLVAPSVDIWTTTHGSDNEYRSLSGSAAATPLVAGLIALIWSADPTLTPDEVERILKETCDDLGSRGVNDLYGYGRINVDRALRRVTGVQIALRGDCPGMVEIGWDRATPRSPMGLLFAAEAGRVTVPSGLCIGTHLGLARDMLQVVATVNTGPDGRGRLTGRAGPAVCGGYVQIVVADASPCSASNVARLP